MYELFFCKRDTLGFSLAQGTRRVEIFIIFLFGLVVCFVIRVLVLKIGNLGSRLDFEGRKVRKAVRIEFAVCKSVDAI